MCVCTKTTATLPIVCVTFTDIAHETQYTAYIYIYIHNSEAVLTLDRKILMYKHEINVYSR